MNKLNLQIHLLPKLGPGKPVIYAGVQPGLGVREYLAAGLLEFLAARTPKWREAPTWGTLALETAPLGRPLLKLGGRLGPSISFSESGDIIWGAMAGKGQVGVDAARQREFSSPYPYSRTFNAREWDWAWRRCQGQATASAALLWAAKEAAVKALGTGFHTFEPGDLEVEFLTPAGEGLDLIVRGKEAVSVWACPLADGWLALAAV